MTTPIADPVALARSRGYLLILAFAALLGLPISVAAYGFLALVSYLQKEVFIHLPHGLGYSSAPAWWPVPVLVVGGTLAALAIRFLPGQGGPSPAYGFGLHPPPEPVQLPGVALAALATLAFGIVLGPEMPLIALGGGLAFAATRLTRLLRGGHPLPDQAVQVLGATGSFAAISALLGSPIVGAFLLMEASGLGGPTLVLVLIPGLLAAGIGALIFTGLGAWTGLGSFSLAVGGLPHVGSPRASEFGWAVVIGIVCALLGAAFRRVAVALHEHVCSGRTMLALPVAGLVIAGLTIAYVEGSGKPGSQVLFSGQTALGPLIVHSARYSVLVLLLLIACKGLAYSISMGSFRGGPVFPSMFIGGAIGLAFSHLPGLDAVTGAAMGIGAMAAVMLTLPLTSVLLASLVLFADGLVVMPLVIVAVVVAYLVGAHVLPQRPDGEPERPAPPAPPAAPARPSGTG